MDAFNAADAKDLALEECKHILTPLVDKIISECKKGYFHLVVPEEQATDAVRVLLLERKFKIQNPNTNNGRKMVTIRWD